MPPKNGSTPPTEVSSKAKRRSFTTQFKLDILAQADACRDSGEEVGALLRKHGLYSSHLSDWRRERQAGELSVAHPKHRGPKPAPKDPSAERIAQLEKQLARMTARAEHAEALVELQKKVAALLGKPLPEPSEKP
jgi:transposase-like protein